MDELILKKRKLDYKLWSTSTIRFNAAKRLNSWKNCIKLSLLSSSIYITTLSILIYLNKINKVNNEQAQLFSLILSIIILLLSFYINIDKIEKKSQGYHKCGRKIRRLLNRLSIINLNNDTKSIDEKIELIQEKYDDILDKYENHSSVDYLQFIFENKYKIHQEDNISLPEKRIVYILYPAWRYCPLILVYLLTMILPMYLIIKILN